MRKLFFLLPILTCACWLFIPAESVAADESGARSKTMTVDNFSLRDYRGHSHELSDVKSDVVVLAFLGTECPLAKLYAKRLQELSDQFDQVAFIGLNPNSQDAITEIAAFARVHKLTFPVLKDVGNKVADAVGCTRTPEVFVLNKKREVVYQGRVDDQYGIGYVREEPQNHDLKDVLEGLLSGKQVRFAKTDAVGCLIGRARKVDPKSAVTYANQISRIMQKHCLECHRDGDIAPFALDEYEEVAGWADMIREVVKENRMPPWHANPAHGTFANARGLSDEERQQINDWVDAGAPKGDLSQLPKPRTYTTGWQLARLPDAEVSMERPYRVPAEGVVRYQNFTIDPKFTEDKWVESAQILPGNRAVVHHILVFAQPPRGHSNENAGGGSFLAGYVPGLRPAQFPKGMAKFVPAGSKLRFQVHYTPIGSEQMDQSKIGFVFADPKTVDHAVVTHEIVNHRFRIPPGADNARFEKTSGAFPEERILLGLMPHMHLRGKSFSYTAMFPKGSKKSDTKLLDVPAYDFNWQTSYRLAEPLPLPAGTKIHCVAHFDNSKNNLNNPDPTNTVGWGDQTWDEMMIGYYDVAIPRAAAEEKTGITRFARQTMQVSDKNGNGTLEKEELRSGWRRYFDRLDTDKDGHLTLEELSQVKR